MKQTFVDDRHRTLYTASYWILEAELGDARRSYQRTGLLIEKTSCAGAFL